MVTALAWAQNQAAPAQGTGGAGAILQMLPMFLLIFAMFYFLILRPQMKTQKEKKALIESLKKGDKVITSSGLLGVITNVHKDIATVQIADNVKVKITKDHIAALRSEKEEGD